LSPADAAEIAMRKDFPKAWSGWRRRKLAARDLFPLSNWPAVRISADGISPS